MARIPKIKMMTGHTKHYDVYETPSNEIYIYTGHSKKQWNNPRYWKTGKALEKVV